jgi:hypothetical protein
MGYTVTVGVRIKSIYIADLLDEYDPTLDPIDPEVRKYYMELLPRLSNAEQDYILNAIIDVG